VVVKADLTRLVVHDNIIKATRTNGAVVQFGYTNGLIFRGNIVRGCEKGAVGLYVWGNSRYNDQPGENVTIADNQITVTETAISLNGTKDVRIHGNILTAPRPLLSKRTEHLTTDFTEQDRAIRIKQTGAGR
jgi:hypothetical protein